MKYNTVNKAYEKKYLNLLKELVLHVFKDHYCKVFLFGSRVNDKHSKGSDYDIGVSGLDNNQFLSLKSRLTEDVENSLIPFKVDIVNFDLVTEEFKAIAMKEVILWKKS
ncbi:nucleotidyltransferase family protein [Candidatus Margulisiibacteriota bacterium]